MTWKPSPDHPWNVRARESAEKAAARKRKAPDGAATAFAALLHDEAEFDYSEERNILRALREPLEP